MELRRLACDFHEGVLTLHGRVSSFYLKQVAQTLVRDLPGVLQVINDLDVRGL
jgi:osmotically-inducible protein OsmY